MRIKRLCRYGLVVLMLMIIAVWSFMLITSEEKRDGPPVGQEAALHKHLGIPKSSKRGLNSNVINNDLLQREDDPLARSNVNYAHKQPNIVVPPLYRERVNVKNVTNSTKPKDTQLHLNVSSNRKGPNEYIKKAILEVNHQQRILNLDRFPNRSPDSVVILVMVHKRLEYLQYLIESLRRASDISDALLVFSHDYYSEEINRVVRAIDFCQTLQIYYPYSLQVYENEFPGSEPNDCPRDLPKHVAKEIKCTNWEHPDIYGHYREVQFVMTKHHWFWKLQHIFTGVRATRNHEGLILLLEEDHYVAPDFYVMLKKMYKTQKKQLPDCNILTLGTYDKNRVYQDRADKADVTDWVSSKHNMGMALDRKTWQNLQSCKEDFCNYDDYNWDWTLQHLSNSCLKPPLVALVLRAPRVFHIGECGIHHTGQCNAEELVKKIDETLRNNERYLFPANLEAPSLNRPPRAKPPKPNGGWGDIRDHTLCVTYGRDQPTATDKLVVV